MWPAIIGAIGAAADMDPVKKTVDGYTFDRWARNDANWEQQKVADKYLDRQEQWSERMSNSAHQREVQDLINAGLNPILSSGGKGASSPNAPSPSGMEIKGGSSPAIQFPGTHPALSSVAGIMQQQQQLDINRARTTADIEKIKAELPNIAAKKNLTRAQTELAQKTTGNKNFELKGVLQNTAEWLKTNVKKTTAPSKQPSSSKKYDY